MHDLYFFCIAEFTGKWERSYINGQPIRYYPQEKRILKILQSTLPILVMILLAIGIVASIYIIRYTVQPK